ncbi:hypothetical protein ACI2KT_34130 [Ensifer adhaerens]
MEMIEFTIVGIGIKGVGVYGQTLATLFAGALCLLVWRNRPRR